MTSYSVNEFNNKKDDENDRVVNISDLIGSWGPFQKRLFILIGLFHCVAPFNGSSLFYFAIKEDIICNKGNGTQVIFQPDKCSLIDLDACLNWDFTSTRVTISKEWTFVCERYWLRSLTLSAYVVGQSIAGLFVGWISDRLGRRFAIKYCIILELFCEFYLITINSEFLFMVGRVFHGIAGFGRSLCSIILLMESVDPQYRGKVMFWYDSSWYLCTLIMIGTSYSVPNFRFMYLGTACYQLICLLLIRFLPESPRWQMVSGQTDRAEVTLRQFSSQMSETRFEEKFKKLKHHLSKFETAERLGMISLFRHRKTVKLVLVLCLIWAVRAIDSSGLHYCTLDLPGNVFFNNFIFHLFAMLAILMMTLRADSHQRKVLLITFFSFNSFLFMYFALFLSGSSHSIVIKIIFISIATFGNAALSGLLYIYTPEVYPTNIRNLGTGVCTVAAEFAACLGPFINQLTSMTNLRTTFIGLSLAALIGALSVTTLPETKGVEMPDTVEQMLLSDSSDEEKL